MKFSQRIGKRPIKTVLQVDSMDEDLRNRLWNTVLEEFFNELNGYSSNHQESQRGKISRLLWKEFFILPIDEIPEHGHSKNVQIDGFMDYLRKWFFKAEWFEVYELIEFIVGVDNAIDYIDFTRACNSALEREVSGYKIVNEKIVQVTSEEEIQAIEDANANTSQLKSVNTHLKTALDQLADRKTPVKNLFQQ